MCSSHFLVLLSSWCPGGNTVVGGVDTKIKEMEPPRKENKLELQRSHDWNNHHQIMVDSFIYSENIEWVPTMFHRIIWVKPDQKKPVLLWTKKRSNCLQRWSQWDDARDRPDSCPAMHLKNRHTANWLEDQCLFISISIKSGDFNFNFYVRISYFPFDWNCFSLSRVPELLSHRILTMWLFWLYGYSSYSDYVVILTILFWLWNCKNFYFFPF